MKKINLIIALLIISIYPLYAIEDIEGDIIFSPKGEINREKDLIEGESEIILEKKDEIEQEEISPYTKQALRGIIEKEYDTTSPKGLFNDQLQLNIKKGPVKSVGLHSHIINTFEESIGENDSDFMGKTSLINVGLQGKLRSEKENYALLFDLTPGIYEDFSHRFILDAYIETKRIPHHTVLFGASRTAIGYEGTMSAKVTPFMLRSQSARHFGNARKTGVKVSGDFKYIDYEIGGYSSDTRFHEFFPGVETTMWMDIKPLAKFNDKYGKLYLGGGINSGSRNSHDFFVASSALRYYYKKLSFLAEYQNADGSNGGTGITENKAYGYNLTLMYRLTKKLELLLRYDDFDSNKSIKHNNSKEYSAGINYYIFGQCVRLMLNYVFCQNDSRDDSHRILLGTQFIL